MTTIHATWVGEPKQTDEVEPYTEDTDPFDIADTKYGVQFTKRGIQTLSAEGPESCR